MFSEATNPITNTRKLSLVERFPRIAKMLRQCWGCREFVEYASSLLVDDRGGREGFPPEIFREICALVELHNTQFPHHECALGSWHKGFWVGEFKSWA